MVWFLTGAWHGASWNFILWGVYFGIILILEKTILLKVLNKIPKIFSHIYAIILILISWAIFAFTDLGNVINYIKVMFGIGNVALVNGEAIYYLKNYIVTIIIGIICSTPLFSKLKTKDNTINAVLETVIYLGLFLLSTASLVSDTYNPFLYFRF